MARNFSEEKQSLFLLTEIHNVLVLGNHMMISSKEYAPQYDLFSSRSLLIGFYRLIIRIKSKDRLRRWGETIFSLVYIAKVLQNQAICVSGALEPHIGMNLGG